MLLQQAALQQQAMMMVEQHRAALSSDLDKISVEEFVPATSMQLQDDDLSDYIDAAIIQPTHTEDDINAGHEITSSTPTPHEEAVPAASTANEPEEPDTSSSDSDSDSDSDSSSDSGSDSDEAPKSSKSSKASKASKASKQAPERAPAKKSGSAKPSGKQARLRQSRDTLREAAPAIPAPLHTLREAAPASTGAEALKEDTAMRNAEGGFAWLPGGPSTPAKDSAAQERKSRYEFKADDPSLLGQQPARPAVARGAQQA